MPNAHRLPALLLAATLCACGSLPARAPVAPPARPSPATPDWLAEAEAALDAGDPLAADRALSRVDPSRLPSEQAIRFQIAQARSLLLEDQPQLAEQALPEPWAIGNRSLAANVESVRADTQARLGLTVTAVSTLVRREALLDTRVQLDQNRDHIWSVLMQAPLDPSIEPQLAKADRITRGWIDLARIIRRSAGAPRPNVLADWRVQYPNHPAELARAQQGPTQAWQSTQWQSSGGPLNRVAVLLPLSGRYAAPASAVREGLFTAWLQSGLPRPSIDVFDTGDSDSSFEQAYREAMYSGADFIIGPLQKEYVARLAGSGSSVPVLALNYLDANQYATGPLYQFGLAPEDEARQAAEQAVSQNQSRAIALVPEGDWGDRVYAAFAERLSQLGGHVAHVRRYSTGQSDFSEQIQDLLALRESQDRHNALRGIIGYSAEFETRPRSDVDFAFVAATPTQARSIRSQFRYFHASELPIYATSIAYDGKRDPSNDLSGLRFCDMPWMLDRSGPWHALRAQIQPSLSPALRSQTRLLALGYDAYKLAEALQAGQLFAGSSIDGASGSLSLDNGNKVSRHLQCAIIHNGGLRMLPAPPAAQPSSTTWP
ncbi:penicillin-binding protein activator [Algiphilus sp. W345]|uniref:Penicillin-binding protein activator n=1 Tax=Banduia mediterranea TaxID=3075609 RepID=A0ABU2WKT5_9GAMM|nr:penicillin-binding protein activator [Algiphilus sp. W345]MDT0498503.1 penicillin-binding protein activator [Algiphilus sp. W345]